MNVALVMGRGGSKSLPGKNSYPVLGRPLALYPILAARSSAAIDRVVVSTDCPDIRRIADEAGVEVIARPPELAGDAAEMRDAILHALEWLGPGVEFLVGMHGNCATHPPGLIDACLAKLKAHPEADACVSGVVDRAVHPFRTRRLAADGTLRPWCEIPAGTSSNRQSLEPCVILDGAARAMRVSTCFPPRGIAPFPYLGEDILLQENPGGLDVHDEDDILLTELFLRRHGWSEEAPAARILQTKVHC